MGEVRDSRWRGQALVGSAREAEAAQRRFESAGDLLIKKLVQKQTNTQTTLEEQLSTTKTFIGEPQEGAAASSHQEHTEGTGAWTVEKLRKKTGLSREELEVLLSVKPNSAVSRLYRFALSNQSEPAGTPDLISLLPDHPLNNLKALEEDLMRNLSKEVKEAKDVVSKKKRKKHRTRKKKILIEQTCQPAPVQESLEEILEPQFLEKHDSSEKTERQLLQDLSTCGSNHNEIGTVSNLATSSTIRDGRKKRPSLWDVKDMSVFNCKRKIDCNPRKTYTVRAGEIMEVTEGSDGRRSDYCSSSSESDVQ